MIELWHCPDARSFRVLWTLEELRVPHRLHVLPFPPRLRAPEFLQVNPLGTIPAFRDGDTFMTESVAIIQYLVARHAPNELGVPAGDPAYGSWLNWLHFGEATLTFPLTLVLRYRQLEPGRLEAAADDYARWFMSRLRQVDRALQGGDWLCAGRFTAADISVGYALLLADFLKLSERFTPAIAAYWGRLQQRAGYQAARRAQGSDMAAEMTAFRSEKVSTMFDAHARVRALLAKYARADLSVAHVLCDGHPPERIAYQVVARDLAVEDLSYARLRADSERCAGALQALGVGRGDRVATLMGKSRDYLATLLGIWRLGAVHVPLFTAFAAPAIDLRLRGSGARVVVCDPDQVAKLTDGSITRLCIGDAPAGARSFDALMAQAVPVRAAAALGGDAPIIEIYTSGTTGAPKGVVVPARALASFEAYGEFAFGLQGDSVFWNAADPGWAYGLYYGILTALAMGVRGVLLQGGFAADLTLQVLARLGVTDFAAAPTVYRSIRASGIAIPKLPRLQRLSSAGEPLTPELIDWSREQFGTVVHDHYGQTETGMLVNNHHHPALAVPTRAGSMGTVMPGWRGAVLQHDSDQLAPAGELGRVAMDLHASPFAWFAGYLGQEQKTREKFSADGRWYVTGDTGRVDADGLWYFNARDDDVIIMAGYRIGPFEVESALATHPAVAESAVVAMPDAVKGEVIVACVVLRSGAVASEALAGELKAWVKTHFAAHAAPRQVHFRAELPKTPSGKVQRFVLRQQLLTARLPP